MTKPRKKVALSIRKRNRVIQAIGPVIIAFRDSHRPVWCRVWGRSCSRRDWSNTGSSVVLEVVSAIDTPLVSILEEICLWRIWQRWRVYTYHKYLGICSFHSRGDVDCYPLYSDRISAAIKIHNRIVRDRAGHYS
jgi:hypothetical protein